MKRQHNTIVSRALLALVALVSVSIPASASIIFDGSGAANNTFQQMFNNPCVIADNSCKEPAGFFDTNQHRTRRLRPVLAGLYCPCGLHHL